MTVGVVVDIVNWALLICHLGRVVLLIPFQPVISYKQDNELVINSVMTQINLCGQV